MSKLEKVITESASKWIEENGEGLELNETNLLKHFKYLNIDVLNTGLQIILNTDGKKYIDENGLDLTEQLFTDLFEDVQANSAYTFISNLGEYKGFGLTSAPGILFGYFYDEQTETYVTDDPSSAKVFWYPEYEGKNFVEELYETNRTFFVEGK